MQTFLPYPDFAATAAVLDRRRLGKQRVEALQVLRGLTVPGYGWRHHPVVLMWRGHEEALVRYGLTICHEWTRQGHSDTVADTLRRELAATRGVVTVRPQARLAADGDLPDWLGRADLHLSHRSALLHKDPQHYRPRFGDLPAVPYVWPTRRPSPSPIGPSGAEILGAD
ncbi:MULTISPECIES: MSMEG_6728 family protein [unclassified Solwaraspora]|uniref:MSMEG_6728 family protein n=1 Tax=unclassified Solwaraspora TaxID=2627926 RepID=UPI00259BD843|nr:MSMEG_6728 family protein [Solwaraspora sp. WMMA2056]WJK38886.1 MSMEG_6728 family protein [Solwaraspora sp. WMMA2056]